MVPRICRRNSLEGRETIADTEGDADERQGLLTARPMPEEDAALSTVATSGVATAAPAAGLHAQDTSHCTLVIPVLDRLPASSALVPVAAIVAPLCVPGALKEPAICRICLEEDLAANMDTPCGCAGTQRYAHAACIQRWVTEKGHLRCEVCKQLYRGAYVAPPAPAPGARPSLADPNHPLRLALRRNASNASASRHGPGGNLFDDPTDAADPYRRQPGMKLFFTAVLFLLFLVLLHNTALMDASPPMDGAGGDSTVPDSGHMPEPAGTPPPIVPDDPNQPTFVDGFILFLFWIATKVLLIGLPLWTILKVAQRQAQQQQYEEMVRAMDPARRVVFRLQVQTESSSRATEMVGPTRAAALPAAAAV